MSKIVYIHRKATNNEVFYIGMGTVKRSKAKDSRSEFWQSVVKKHNYNIEVVAYDLTLSEALELEAFLVSIYGLENLCNHTTGGEHTIHSKSSVLKMKLNSPNARAVIDTSKNYCYNSLTEACELLGYKRTTVLNQLNGVSRRSSWNTLYFDD